ncbi:MAG: hypothetical protein H8E46_04155 [FCB group bacterium]|nr:hypothetical protein [FCB group bacterium]
MKKHLYMFGIFAALAAFIIFPKWTVDDAYITYRYAANLANHAELTWNPGEDPIEGYTGVAMPVIMAAIIKLGLSPVVTGKIIGVLAFILGGIFLNLILRLLRLRSSAVSLALILYLTAPFMVVHAYSGLETMLFTAMILVSIYFLLSVLIKTDRIKTCLNCLYISLLFLSLVRPEGVILAVTSTIALGIITLKYDRMNLKVFAFRFILLYFLPGSIYFVWRISYYGQVLPNTFYAKSSAAFFNLFSILKFVQFSIFFLLLPALILLILYLMNKKSAVKHFKQHFSFIPKPGFTVTLISLAAFSFLVLFQYMRSQLLMNYEFRFYVPFFPVFLLFLGIFMNSGFSLFDQNSAADSKAGLKTPARRIAGITLAVLLLLQAAVYAKQFKKYMFFKRGYEMMMAAEQIAAGKFLKENVPPDEWLIVIHDVGAIPYFSELKTVDYSRLNDEYLSRKKLTGEQITDYFYSFNAGALAITSYKWDVLEQVWIHGDEVSLIASDPRFENYRLVKKFRSDVPPDHPGYDYFMFVYLRNDLAESSDTE